MRFAICAKLFVSFVVEIKVNSYYNINMFTGIIEEKGKIIGIKKFPDKFEIKIQASLSKFLQRGSSVAVDGICLTAVDINDEDFLIEAVKSTVDLTTLKWAKIGQYVNLERSLTLQKELGGHLVLGHIDGIGRLINIKRNYSFIVHRYEIDSKGIKYLIPKGSICINGVSLTIADVKDNTFEINLIPFTLKNTNLGDLEKGSYVNIEFDIIGKYIYNFLQERKKESNKKIKESKLRFFLKEEKN